MRFLADENVRADIVQGLRKAGVEVFYVPDVGLAGESDQKILGYAVSRGMTLITGDKDFGGLSEFGTLWGRGRVILLRYRLIDANRTVDNITDVIAREGDIITKEKSFVIVLSEAGYRVHRHVDN